MVEISGPITHADESFAITLDEIDDAIADRAKAMWLANLNSSIRVNTGRYVSHINIRREADSWVVNDAGVVYGPWLEGTGSRNYPVTVFPGYFSARRAVEELEPIASLIAGERIDKFVLEMNA